MIKKHAKQGVGDGKKGVGVPNDNEGAWKVGDDTFLKLQEENKDDSPIKSQNL